MRKIDVGFDLGNEYFIACRDSCHTLGCDLSLTPLKKGNCSKLPVRDWYF